MKTTKIITLIAIVILAISCKKEEQNNVNIEDRTVNISLSTNTTSNDSIINLDSDGTDDFRIYSSLPGGINSNSQIGINSVNGYEFSTESQGFSNEIIRTFSKNTEINASTTTWKADALFYFFDANLPTPNKLGYNDAGYKYIAFRTTANNINYKYGWMLVNISGGHTISIIEFALYTLDDVAIKIGEK